MRMKLIEVKEIPFETRKNRCAKLVKDFLNAGIKCAKIELEGENEGSIRSALSHYITRNDLKDKVKYTTRSGEIYLVRVDKG